jgi:hypothetical protein
VQPRPSGRECRNRSGLSHRCLCPTRTKSAKGQVVCIKKSALCCTVCWLKGHKESWYGNFAGNNDVPFADHFRSARCNYFIKCFLTVCWPFSASKWSIFYMGLRDLLLTIYVSKCDNFMKGLVTVCWPFADPLVSIFRNYGGAFVWSPFCFKIAKLS